MEVIMNKLYGLLALVLSSFLPLCGYTKKIEILQNPGKESNVILFYDCHADERFPVDSQKQVADIIALAKKYSAHILIEDIFDYKGSHQSVLAGIERNKYKKPVFLLRDVSDAAKRLGIGCDNLDYRQDMQYSINGTEISAQKAFETVERIIRTIENFKDPELVDVYDEYLAEFKKLHQQLKDCFDQEKAISDQLRKSEIGKKLLNLADKIPVLCTIPAHVIMLYDVRLMNFLLAHRIYELQKSKTDKKYIFVIAGSYHINDLSNLLQTKLNYTKVADSDLEKSENELVNIEKFLKDYMPHQEEHPTRLMRLFNYISQLFSWIISRGKTTINRGYYE